MSKKNIKPLKPLTKPLTHEQIREMAAKNDGYVSGVIPMYLGEMCDIDECNNLASEKLIGNEALLEDISYEIVGHGKDNLLYVEVTGTLDLDGLENYNDCC